MSALPDMNTPARPKCHVEEQTSLWSASQGRLWSAHG